MRRHRGRPRATRLLLLLPLLILAGTLLLSACGRDDVPGARREYAGGDPEIGALLIDEYGCKSCHIVPGIKGAIGIVGPPLTNWARRNYIAGKLPNTAENLILWIQYPQQVEPGTAMPDLGVSTREARHIATYLYTLE